VYVAVLSNVVGSERDPGALARKAAAIAIGKPVTNPAVVALTAGQLDAFVGRFVNAAGARHIVTREGTRVFVQIASGRRTEFFPSGNDTFFEKDGFTRLRFQRDAAGTFIRMEIDNWGAQAPATRDTTPEKPGSVAIAVDPAIYDAYVGEYELVPGFVLTVTREGDRLMTQATGQGKFEVFPSAPTEFFLKVVDAQISFVKNDTGGVTGLVLHQGGRDMPARKIK
jgi:hypothetical protein